MKRFDFYLSMELIQRVDRARARIGNLSRSAFLRQSLVEKIDRIKGDND